MYFFTQSDQADVSSYAQVATFFIDKFPAAFGATATYYNSKEQSSEEAYIRIDKATSVEYDFGEQGQHAQKFANFQKKVLKSFTQDSEAKSAIFLLELLLRQKENILQLPTLTKQAECTVQRFYLLLQPLLNLAEEGDYAKAKALTVKFADLLVEESQFSLKIKVDALVQLYNSVHTQTGIKAFAFEKLLELCQRENCLDIVVDQARNVVKTASTWTLTKEEQRTLFMKVARCLDNAGEFSSAFRVMHAYIRLIENSEDASAEDDARRCVILAIKAVDIINFAELVELPAIQQLTKKHAKVSSLLGLFNTATASEFKGKLAEYKDLMASEGLTEQELIVKKSHVLICTLDTQTTNFSYAELSSLLNIDVDDIEMWAIEAIQNKIIDAKIDQANEHIVIKSHMLREIKLKEWQAIQQRIRAWKERFQQVKAVLSASQQVQAKAVAQ